MWESQVLLTDGQVVFLRVLRFSPTFDERSARYKWNILERAVKPKSKKKKKKKQNKKTNAEIKWSIISKSVMIVIFVEFIDQLIDYPIYPINRASPIQIQDQFQQNEPYHRKKCLLGKSGQQRPRSGCIFVQHFLRLCCLPTELLVTVEYHIWPNYRTMHLGFSKLLGKFLW